MRLRGITIDVAERERSERFWGGLFGVAVSGRLDQYSYFDEVAPGVRLILQVVDDPKRTKNRLHLDLQPDDHDEAVRRILELGGSVVGEVDDPSYALTVAADPDGNEFCVARRLSGPLA
ncbi:MAG: VOC family protein [Acidimicrobiia bacterium]|nr:VOC family protein [Acidimicrobiia bacterium]